MAKNSDKAGDTGTDAPNNAPEPTVAAGAALTPGQAAGLDPIDPAKNAEEAANRAKMPNMQTTHELDNGLDPLSQSPNPGVAPNAALTAVTAGRPVSDMSGRPPIDPAAMERVRDGLRAAKSDDKDSGDARRGARTPQELGVPRAQLEAMIADGAPLESEDVPAGHFFPETGRRFRLK